VLTLEELEKRLNYAVVNKKEVKKGVLDLSAITDKDVGEDADDGVKRHHDAKPGEDDSPGKYMLMTAVWKDTTMRNRGRMIVLVRSWIRRIWRLDSNP
jgi:hypothetical protein